MGLNFSRMFRENTQKLLRHVELQSSVSVFYSVFDAVFLFLFFFSRLNKSPVWKNNELLVISFFVVAMTSVTQNFTDVP